MKFRKLLLLITGFCSLWLLPVNAQSSFDRAEKQFEMGMYGESVKTLEKIQVESKLESDGLWLLARGYEYTNEPAMSVGICERLENTFGGSDPLYVLWGQQLKKLGAYDTAENVFENIQDASLKAHMVAGCNVQPLIESAQDVELVNLPINTPNAEFGATTVNGRLVFASSRSDMLRPSQVNSKVRNAMRNQLYAVAIESGIPSSKPTFLRSDIKDHWNNGPVTFASEGGMVCFVKNNYTDGHSQIISSDKTQSLYFSEMKASGDWEEPWAFPHNSVKYSNAFPFLTPDGGTLYFASNKPGGAGGYDLYVSQLDGETWSEPVSVAGVNTQGDEVSPNVEGAYLYFASNWHVGLGGFDVFRTDIGDPGVQIENMGGGINTPSDDYGFVYNSDENVGYLTSNRFGGQGNEDVYAVKMKKDYTPVVVSTNMVVEKPVKTEVNTTVKPVKAVTTEGGTIMRPYDNDQGVDPEDGEIRVVYSIQVAALSPNNEAFNQIAEKLDDIGDVYKIYFSNVVKIRVGSFEKEQKARRMLEVVKQRGYNDAFIVKEEVVVKDETYQIEVEEAEEETTEEIEEKIVMEVEAEKPEKEPKVGAPGAREIMEDIGAERLKDMPIYRVRIAAYTNPEWFDRQEIEGLGTIYEENNDEWTVFYLGDFLTIEDAEAVRLKVVKSGYSAAQLYTLRNEELIKLR